MNDKQVVEAFLAELGNEPGASDKQVVEAFLTEVSNAEPDMPETVNQLLPVNLAMERDDLVFYLERALLEKQEQHAREPDEELESGIAQVRQFISWVKAHPWDRIFLGLFPESIYMPAIDDDDVEYV